MCVTDCDWVYDWLCDCLCGSFTDGSTVYSIVRAHIRWCLNSVCLNTVYGAHDVLECCVLENRSTTRLEHRAQDVCLNTVPWMCA
jgi:hypothetical protein